MSTCKVEAYRLMRIGGICIYMECLVVLGGDH